MNQDELIKKVSIRLIPFMLVLYVVSYLDRINVSFAALQMNQDLGFSDQAFGFGAGIFFFGYCIFGIPSNLVIKRLGARKWISSIMIIWGLITIAICLVRDATQFYILRFLLGLAEAGFFPGMIYYLTFWFPQEYYAVAVARFMIAIPVAGLVGSAIAAQALSMDGVAGIAGWMWLFIVTGLPAVVLGVAVLFLMPDSPHQARWLTNDQAAQIAEMVRSEEEQQTGALDEFVGTVRELTAWRFALLYFSLTISMYGFQLWLPQIIKTFGDISDSTTALLAAIPAIFQGLGMLVIAGSSDRTGERKYHLVSAAALTCLGLAISSVADNSLVRMSGLCLAAFGIWGSVGPFWALTARCLRREHHPTGIALINSVGNLGGFAGPFLVGVVKQCTQGFSGSLIALAVASVVAAVLAATTATGEKRT